MDAIEFFSFLRQFNADTVLIGAAVWGLTLLLKKTVLKKLTKKLLTFVPFVLGIALSAAVAAIFGAEGWEQAVAQGVTCGSLATVIHVVCRQFSAGSRADAKAACVQAMLLPYRALSDEEAAELAQAMDGDEAEATERLAGYAGEAAAALYPLLKRTLGLL